MNKLLSSLQDSSYGVPIGTVMAWPLDSAPRGLHRDRWLECNGQSVDSNKYPRLAKLMSNVPDYRGLFLRGLGSQDYSQQNGLYHGVTTTTYNSSGLGETQGDATRHVYGLMGFNQGGGPLNGTPIDKGDYDGVFYRDYSISYQSYDQMLASYPQIGVGRYLNGGINTSVQNNISQTWAEALRRDNYSLDVSYGSTKDGDSYVSGITLTKNSEYPVLPFSNTSHGWAADNEIQVPIADEVYNGTMN